MHRSHELLCRFFPTTAPLPNTRSSLAHVLCNRSPVAFGFSTFSCWLFCVFLVLSLWVRLHLWRNEWNATQIHCFNCLNNRFSYKWTLRNCPLPHSVSLQERGSYELCKTLLLLPWEKNAESLQFQMQGHANLITSEWQIGPQVQLVGAEFQVLCMNHLGLLLSRGYWLLWYPKDLLLWKPIVLICNSLHQLHCPHQAAELGSSTCETVALNTNLPNLRTFKCNNTQIWSQVSDK